MLRSSGHPGDEAAGPRCRRAGPAALAGALALAAPVAAAGAPLQIVYTGAEAAGVIADGADGLPGLPRALRQAPALPDQRWPSARLMGKVSGDALAALATPEEMAAALTGGWRTITAGGATTQVGGRVGVDEITPADWTTQRAMMLHRAMVLLGPGAERVVFYASPALVEQVGRRDPRKRLPRRLSALVGALGAGGHTFLEVYRGTLQPFPLRQMANHLTRWRNRWPAGRRGALHVLIGPPGWASQKQIWSRVRATPAGRALLANGPGAFGLRSAEDGRAWLAEYRAFLRRPTAPPPSGEARLTPVGGVRVFVRTNARLPAGSTFRLRVGRPGNAIVLLRPRVGKRRIIGRLSVRSSRTTSVRIPPRTAPGRWRIMVFMSGEGIKDEVHRNVRIVPSPERDPRRSTPSKGAT